MHTALTQQITTLLQESFCPTQTSLQLSTISPAVLRALTNAFTLYIPYLEVLKTSKLHITHPVAIEITQLTLITFPQKEEEVIARCYLKIPTRTWCIRAEHYNLGLGFFFQYDTSTKNIEGSLCTCQTPHTPSERERIYTIASRAQCAPYILSIPEGESKSFCTMFYDRGCLNVASDMDSSTFTRIALKLLALLIKLGKLGIIHHNIQPQHILLNSQGNVTLCGYSCSTDKQSPQTSCQGRIEYFSPEKLRLDRLTQLSKNLDHFPINFTRQYQDSLPYEDNMCKRHVEEYASFIKTSFCNILEQIPYASMAKSDVFALGLTLWQLKEGSTQLHFQKRECIPCWHFESHDLCPYTKQICLFEEHLIALQQRTDPSSLAFVFTKMFDPSLKKRLSAKKAYEALCPFATAVPLPLEYTPISPGITPPLSPKPLDLTQDIRNQGCCTMC